MFYYRVILFLFMMTIIHGANSRQSYYFKLAGAQRALVFWQGDLSYDCLTLDRRQYLYLDC
jgi:hypothetical protein